MCQLGGNKGRRNTSVGLQVLVSCEAGHLGDWAPCVEGVFERALTRARDRLLHTNVASSPVVQLPTGTIEVRLCHQPGDTWTTDRRITVEAHLDPPQCSPTRTVSDGAVPNAHIIVSAIHDALCCLQSYGLAQPTDIDYWLYNTFPQYACGELGEVRAKMVTEFVTQHMLGRKRLHSLETAVTSTHPSDARAISRTYQCSTLWSALVLKVDLPDLYWPFQWAVTLATSDDFVTLELWGLLLHQLLHFWRAYPGQDRTGRLAHGLARRAARAIVQSVAGGDTAPCRILASLASTDADAAAFLEAHSTARRIPCTGPTHEGGVEHASTAPPHTNWPKDVVAKLNLLLPRSLRSKGPRTASTDNPRVAKATTACRGELPAVGGALYVSARAHNLSGAQTGLAPPIVWTPSQPGKPDSSPVTDKGLPKSATLATSLHVRITNPSATRKQLKPLNAMFPPTTEVDNRHMTTHLASLIWNYLNWAPEPAQVPALGDVLAGLDKRTRLSTVNRVLSKIPLGTPQQVVSAMLLISMDGGDTAQLVMDQLLQPGFFLDCVRGQQAKLKDFSTYIRKCGADLRGRDLTPQEVGVLAYYDMCYGRSLHTTDWKAERVNRSSHTLHILPPAAPKFDNKCVHQWVGEDVQLNPQLHRRHEEWYSALKREIKDIIAALVPSKGPVSETFSSFYARRQEWMSSGSSAGFKIANPSLTSHSGADPRNATLRAGKRAWAEATTYAEVRAAMAEAVPREYAKGSEKYENGKSRAIYGVEPLHYVINTYATKGLEERLLNVPGLEKGVTGINAVALELHRAQLTADPRIHCTMLDFADFNRHHTPEAQATIFTALAERGEEVGAARDWVKANRWVARSKYQMWAHYPGLGDAPVLQGMFSGTRSTDLINTILNLAYFRVASKSVADIVGSHPSHLYHVHQGDDVWISNEDKLWARLVYAVMNGQGFIFSPPKQMFGQARGEYLRVLYARGTARGYLGRALANFIQRPLQNDVAQTPRAWAATATSGVATLARRGLPRLAVCVLWSDTIQHWCTTRSHPSDKRPVAAPLELIATPSICGGYGAAPPYSVVNSNSIRILPPEPVARPPSYDLLADLPHAMTEDWVAHVSAKYKAANSSQSQRQIRSQLLKEALARDNYSDVAAAITPHSYRRRDKADFTRFVDAILGPKPSPRQVNSRIAKLLLPASLAREERGPPSLPPQEKAPTSACGVAPRLLINDPTIQANMAGTLGQPSYIKKDLQPYNGTQAVLGKMFASSRFKSVNLTTLALGGSKIEAIQAIAHDQALSSQLDASVSSVLSAATHIDDDVLVGLVSGETSPALSAFAYDCNMGLAQYLSASTASSRLQALALESVPNVKALALELDRGLHDMVANVQRTVAWQCTVLY